MSDQPTIQSLVRGLSIVDALAEAADGLSLADVAARLDLKPPTAHNLLRTLVASGYAERRTGPTRYVLGPRLLDAAARHQSLGLQSRVAETMQRLGQAMPDVTWSYCEGIDGDVIRTVDMGPQNMGRPRIFRGGPMGAYQSATSLLFLAYWGMQAREAYERRYPPAEYAPPHLIDPAALDVYLAEIRSQGYSAPPEEHTDNARVAAPVFDATGRLVGGLGGYLVGRQSRPGQDRESLIAALTAAAAELSRPGGRTG